MVTCTALHVRCKYRLFADLHVLMTVCECHTSVEQVLRDMPSAAWHLERLMPIIMGMV